MNNTSQQPKSSMKKSVEDIIYGTHEAIGNLSLSNLNVLQTQTSALLSKHNSVTSLYSGSIKSENITAEDSISKSSDTSGDTTDKPKSTSKLSQRAKKKTWYSAIYPCYKSRSEDFKKLFKEVPSDERLVVDYSCAVQRDILVHGRLYVTQNYICFYANIFGWETNFSIKWSEVQSITKEKTAIVIPNAILICTEKDRHFFTSFATRDKAFLILFRIWQNVLMEKQLSPQELWQFVHSSYGEELGLTSDDDDYIDPNDTSNEFDKLLELIPKEKENLSSENSFQKIEDTSEIKMKENNQLAKGGEGDAGENPVISEEKQVKRKISKASRRGDDFAANKDPEQIPTDMSDSSSDSDENNVPFVSTAECTSPHEGRQLVHTILPINVDVLFNLLFSKSKFLLDFHHTKKSTDLNFGDWVTDENGIKTRTVNLTVALAQSVGPKTSKVTETQRLRECSKPGELYSIDVDSVNAGIPYADSFMVIMHYCLVRTVDDHTMLSVHANIKYKKSIWGMVKGFIEKNTWNGLDEFYSSLLRSLQSETCVPPAKGKGRRPRRGTNTLARNTEENTIIGQQISNNHHHHPVTEVSQNKNILNPSSIEVIQEPKGGSYKNVSIFVILLLISLIILNIILLFKLWTLDDKIANDFLVKLPNLSSFKTLPNNHGEWLELLRKQEALHETELKKWHTILQTAIELLKKTENALAELVIKKNFIPSNAE